MKPDTKNVAEVRIAKTRVIKLGGSLLGSSGWKHRVAHWLDREKQIQGDAGTVDSDRNRMQNIWVVGGGQFVNRLRNWQAAYSLTELECHKIAIEMMSINAMQVARKFEWQIAGGLDDIQNRIQRNLILDPMFLIGAKQSSARVQRMPKNWTVTSDSIAAVVATELDAIELILLKSCLLYTSPSPRDGLLSRMPSSA